jgi:hypothetical protein
MKNKSVIEEADDVRRAVEMVQLGARMQMLEVETRLSREKLLKIYKEVRGVSPPKGMLPFSTDWFMTWQPNVHSSLFMGFHRFFTARGRARAGRDPQVLSPLPRPYRERGDRAGAQPHAGVDAGALLRCRPAAARGLHLLRRAVRRPRPRSGARATCAACATCPRARAPRARRPPRGKRGVAHAQARNRLRAWSRPDAAIAVMAAL